jgi:hypothetical protein
MYFPNRGPTEGNNRRTCQRAKQQLKTACPAATLDKMIPFVDIGNVPSPPMVCVKLPKSVCCMWPFEGRVIDDTAPTQRRAEGHQRKERARMKPPGKAFFVSELRKPLHG